MAINQEMTKGSQGEWHQDWQDSHRIFNCVVPFGKFTGADLALWQPKVRLQLSRGEAFFFFWISSGTQSNAGGVWSAFLCGTIYP
jgi:hypothetical protein